MSASPFPGVGVSGDFNPEEEASLCSAPPALKAAAAGFRVITQPVVENDVFFLKLRCLSQTDVQGPQSCRESRALRF